MRRFLLLLFSSIAGLVLWATLAVLGTLNGWLHESLAPVGNTRAFMDAAVAEINTNYHGNVAFVLIQDGQIYDEYFVSIGAPVDGNTLFQVASLSKWITALGVMALVEEGRLDLDVPVSTYLTRWELPKSEFGNDGVTVRRLLSHTSGLTDGLGFAGFPPGTEVQSLEEALSHPNASPGHDGRVRVGYAPGTEFQYSGGGYLLLQLLVEEVTGDTFESHMQQAVFQPLGMSRSTYLVDKSTTSNLALSYEANGTPGILMDFTAAAAAGLYTSAYDLARLIQAYLPDPNGASAGRGVFKSETLELMRQPHASALGMDIWGLGTMLFVPNHDRDFIIGHDGSNEPAINTTARLNPTTGDGIVVLETGNRLLATTVAGEWGFWQTGKMDILMVKMSADRMVAIIGIGWIVIFVISLLFGWRMRRSPRGATAESVL
jgi:CubicO group peptidase (beta-lactamase class C family)